MRTTIVALLGAIGVGTLTLVMPASAEPFSVQGFSGGPIGQDALPGVRLNSEGTVSPEAKCVERSPDRIDRYNLYGGTVQECSFGNFSITTSQGSTDFFKPTMHNQFGHRPLPGWESWRP